MNEKELKSCDGRYYFQDREISRRQYHKIRYGNWSCLSSDAIADKLANKAMRQQKKEGYEIIYEAILAQPLGQYCLGVAQEKVANEVIKTANRLKNEGRRIVRANKDKVK
jgi:hypothetical protein